MFSRFSKISSSLAAAVVITSLSHAATTDPYGAMVLNFDASSDTFVSLAFHRPEVFRGTVDNVDDSGDNVVLTVSATTGWTDTAFTSASDTNTYYMIVCNGPLVDTGRTYTDSNDQEQPIFEPAANSEEGAFITVIGSGVEDGTGKGQLIFDKTEFNLAINDLNNLTDVDIDGEAPLDNVAIKVIPYWTLSTLFPNQEGIVARTGSAIADSSEILLPYVPDKNDPDSIGTGEVGRNIPAAVRVQYYDVSNDDFDGWYTSLDQPFDHFPLNPSQFIVVRTRATADQDVVLVGAVPLNAIRVPVGTLVDGIAQDNAIAFSVPVTMTISELNLIPNVIEPTDPSGSIANIDEVLVYNNANTGFDKSAATRLIYYDGFGWFDTLDQPQDDFEINPGDAIIIRKKAKPTASFVNWTFINNAILSVSER